MPLPTSVLKLGLGGSFRRRLMQEANVAGCWPLADLSTAGPIRDISGEMNTGTLSGTGWTAGVPFAIPEGALGLTFDGNGYISVVDPTPGESGGAKNLSLASGSMDIVFLMKTSTNDATLRCIVQKQETNSSGNGWHVALQNGAIEFYLKVSGSTVFSFQRGSVADGAEHLIHCHYAPGSNLARIYVDGVASGADATGTTEGVATSVDLRIGTFTDGAGDFVGTLCYVMIGRQGDASISSELQAMRSWTDVSADVLTGSDPLHARYGIGGVGPVDKVASSGLFTFTMNNAATNSAGLVGYYSPAHANCRSGFNLGIPVRWELSYGGTTYYKFRGFLRSIVPLPGSARERETRVTATDWLDTAAIIMVSGVPAQIAQSSTEAFRVVTDAMSVPPAAVDLESGAETFEYAIDAPNRKVLTEYGRIAMSEMGQIYMRGDTTQGGTLCYESRAHRQIATTDATFASTMQELELEYDLKETINLIRVTIYPRQVDTAATTVLYALTGTKQVIGPGETIVIEGRYKDPSNPVAQAGGIDLVTPVATTDYTLNVSDDDSGPDLTSYLTVDVVTGGSSTVFTLTNEASQPGYLTKLQIRGRGIYTYAPITIERQDAPSVREIGARALDLDMPYQSSVNTATSVGDYLLNIYVNRLPAVRRLTIAADRNATLLVQALAREVGDRVAFSEAVTGATTDAAYYIQNVDLTLGGGQFTCAWGLTPSSETGVFWLLGETGFGELDETTYLGA